MKRFSLAFISAFLMLTIFGCQSESQQILFLGHPYQWRAAGVRIDYRVEAIDHFKYDKLWLGGDLCAKTTEKKTTLLYLDSLLDLDSPDVHWSLGNHDVLYGHLDWIQEVSKRPSFYSSWEDGYTLLVLNTNLFIWGNERPADSLCSIMDAQLHLIKTVCDTIQAASHLVVLHHQCLLTNEITAGTKDLAKVFNYYQPDFKVGCEKDSSTFSNTIYLDLLKVQQQGIPVILVGGDMGMRAKKFEYQTEDGMVFLGAGINNSVPDDFRPDYITNFDPDQVLIFNYQDGEMSWRFSELRGMRNEE